MLAKLKLLTVGIGMVAMVLPFGLLSVPTTKAMPANTMDNLRTVAGSSYEANTDENTLLTNISLIIKRVLELLGFIFVVLMIYAGIIWMTAGGNEKQVEKAKNIISRAAIGLIIIVSAYAITYFIFANLPGGAIEVAN